VETKEQLASLMSEGCDEFQGFYFSQPRPAADLARMFDEDASRTKPAT
jgi:EAL domain-containing protein (putative c-di-GMP-specific phosphodiesterase class I)